MKLFLFFPGQGSQIIGMGKTWYQASKTVRQVFDTADKILQPFFPQKLSELCWNGSPERLQETRICQPALFVLGYAIAEHFKQNGVFTQHPLVGATGISLGELTALACAGVWDFETGLQIVAERGRLMQEACTLEPTGMTALIGGTDEAITDLCQELDLDISNRNCPGQTVVSGTLPHLKTLSSIAKERGFKMAIPLKVAGAYHSRWMQPAREKLEKFLQKIPFHAPQISVISDTLAQPFSDPELIRTELGRQLTSTVQFEKCLRFCRTLSFDRGIECGCGNVIAGLAKRIDPSWILQSAAEPNDSLFS
ncbi:MAG: ACP S-malonyltransferase [Opitutales bacterium]|nr:ACP S-malonyltransferase [Opitutales bacterium]